MKRIKEIEKYAHHYFEDKLNAAVFIAGAIWADNNPVNIWHDAEEEPKGECCDIIYDDADGNCNVVSISIAELSYGGWAKFVERKSVIAWADIVDVLALKYRGIELTEGGEE